MKLTRKSKVGFGWNTQPTGRGTCIETTTEPCIVGTFKTVVEKRDHDSVWNSIKSTYKTTAWFTRIDGEWKKISADDIDQAIYSMLLPYPEGGYCSDSIEVEING